MNRIVKLLSVGLSLFMVVSLAGCSLAENLVGKPSEPPSQVTANPDATMAVTDDPNALLSPPPQISFGLTEPEHNDFGDPGVAQSTGATTGLYTIGEDGYAYALDPVTFGPVGEPLDPLTHEPIAVTATTEPSAEPTEPPEVLPTIPPTAPPVETVPPTVPPTVQPTVSPENKLPNMGLFTEDD